MTLSAYDSVSGTGHGTYVIFSINPMLTSIGSIPTWLVLAKASYAIIGEVKWFSRWRKYCFFPESETVFEEVYLRDIAEFCEERTKAQRLIHKDTEAQRKKA